MRKVFVVLGMLTVVSLSAGLVQSQEGPYVPQPAVNADCGCNECPDCSATTSCPHCGKCAANRAAFGCFNCACRGSYKYPVLPQYTYFWPGMYSQQTMTAYTSPYRFPPLNLPPDMGTPSAPVNKTPPKLSRVNQASYLQMPEMSVIDHYDRNR